MIAEDERLAREELEFLLQQEKDVSLLPSAENGEQLLILYEKYHPDVIFLDIHMPGLTGIEVAETLHSKKSNRKPVIVFTTAYDNYGVKAFELHATDYLLKPFDKTRFQMAMNRIREVVLSKESNMPKIDKLVVTEEEKIIIIKPEQIGYAVREGRTLRIHALDNRIIETKMSLKELEDKLIGFPFYRSHRSYLVNLDAIEMITPWFNGAYNLIINDRLKSKVPVSRTAAKGLFEVIQGVD